MKNNSLFIPQRPSDSGAYSMSQPTASRSQQAVADLTRAQIESIYDGDENATMPVTTAVADSQSQQPQDDAASTPVTSLASDSSYAKVHNDEAATKLSGDWQEYHSAWQKYYQQYFQYYYAGHLQQAHEALKVQTEKTAQLETKQNYERTPEEATNELRSQIKAKVSSKARAVKKSRHFYPIVAGCAVMLLFLFLQYNRVLFAYVEAYTSPGASVPDNIIIDPTSTIAVSDEPRLVIPKINVDVPVIYDNTMGKTNKETYDLQMAAMSKGVAWFGVPKANSKPGQVGNTVLSGHSSSEWFETGPYKFIFARLESLQQNDTIYANYEGTRYAYKVTKMQVVKPSDVAALQVDTDKPLLTLITCVPLGTANSRLLVTAEQITPDPNAAKAAPDSSSSETNTAIPGQSETFFERVF